MQEMQEQLESIKSQINTNYVENKVENMNTTNVEKTKKLDNVTNKMLFQMERERMHCAIYTVNSKKMNGIFAGSDNFTVVLADKISQEEITKTELTLMFKHAITSIAPGKKVDIENVNQKEFEEKYNSFSVQNLILNELRKGKNKVNVFLINGTKLSGVIKSFEEFSIILSSNIDNTPLIVFKGGISSISTVGMNKD